MTHPYTQDTCTAVAQSIIACLGNLGAEKFLETKSRFHDFQQDPVGFGEQILGEHYTDDVKAMMESVRDNEVTVALSSNGVGKTHSAGRLGVWFLKCFEDSQVYTAAAPPESNLRKLLWGEIGSITDKHSSLFENYQVNTLNIQGSSRHFLTGVTIPTSGDEKTREARFSGKHSKNMMFILDEGDAIPDEVYKGIEACASGGHFRVLIMLNPRQPKGAVYRMIRPDETGRPARANVVHLSAFRHPNVVTGENVIPGAVDRNTTARRIVQMCRRMTDEEVAELGELSVDEQDALSDVFRLPTFLEGYRALDQKKVLLSALEPGMYKVMDQAFCHMVLGRYPAQAADQLISMEWIQKARMRWDLWVKRYGEVPPDRAQGIAGVDVGELGNDPSVWFARYGGWLTQAKQWSGVDTNHTSDRAIEFGKQGSVICTNFDGNGVGAGCAPNVMRKGYPARGVKTQEKPDDREKQPEWGEFKILRDQLGWEVREWLRADPTSMLPPDEELIEELAVFTYEVKGRWIQLMKKDVVYDLLKRSPNKFSALCLTFAKPLDVSGASSGMSAQRAAELRAKHSRYGYVRGRG